MEKIYSKIFSADFKKTKARSQNLKLKFGLEFILSLSSVLLTCFKGKFAIKFHLFIVRKALIALIKKRISFNEAYYLLINPIDSFRYFEFYYGYQFIKKLSTKEVLDISSPRFFSAYLLNKFKIESSILLNPDKNDIELTKILFDKLSIKANCQYLNQLIENVSFDNSRFDLVYSISVLEHIPLENIDKIINLIIEILKPDGYFLMSIPISKNSFEEYIDFNEYELHSPSENGFYFGQRFHDESLIYELFYKKLGNPVAVKLITESQEGFFFNDRYDKINNPSHKLWNEAFRFSQNYRIIESFKDLTGIGVGMFLFQIKK